MGRKRKVLKEIDLNGDGYDYDEVADSTSETIDKKIAAVTGASTTISEDIDKKVDEGKQEEKINLDSSTLPAAVDSQSPTSTPPTLEKKCKVGGGRKRKQPQQTSIIVDDVGGGGDKSIPNQINKKKQRRPTAAAAATKTTTTTLTHLDKERQYEETIRRRLEKEYEDRERKRIREEKKMEEKVRRMVEQQLYMHNMATYQPRVNSGIKRVSVIGGGGGSRNGKQDDDDDDDGYADVETEQPKSQSQTELGNRNNKENVQPKVDRRDQLFTMIFRR